MKKILDLLSVHLNCMAGKMTVLNNLAAKSKPFYMFFLISLHSEHKPGK